MRNYVTASEVHTKVELDNTAVALAQPAAHLARDSIVAGITRPGDLALVLYQPLCQPSAARGFYVSPTGITYEVVDGQIVKPKRRSRRGKPQVRKSKSCKGPLPVILYQPRESQRHKFYVTEAGVVHKVVESSAGTTGLDALPLVVYRPPCISSLVGYRKFYVTAAGRAYQIVGRSMPKHRTRRSKKNKARKAEVDGEDKENAKNREKQQSKKKIRVQQTKTPGSRRWCSEQKQAAHTAAGGTCAPSIDAGILSGL